MVWTVFFGSTGKFKYMENHVEKRIKTPLPYIGDIANYGKVSFIQFIDIYYLETYRE
jgi:hypothetical protein